MSEWQQFCCVAGCVSPTCLGEVSIVPKHVLVGFHGRCLPGVDGLHLACSGPQEVNALLPPCAVSLLLTHSLTCVGTVDDEVEAAADAHAVGVDQTDAQQGGDGGVHGRAILF